MKTRRSLFPSPLPPSVLAARSNARPPAYFYFIAASLLLLIIAAAWRTIDDSMLLLHLKVGDKILQDHQIPNRDIFSAASFTDFWYLIQWGWAVIVAKSFSVWQWTGLAVLNVTCVAATTALLIRRSRRHGGRWFESLIVSGIVMAALIPDFQPNAASAALLLWIIALSLVEGSRLRMMALLPIVAIIWANVHPSFMAAALLPLARLAFPAPSTNEEPRRSPSVYLFVITIGCIIGSLITPHSIGIVQGLVTTVAVSTSRTVGEWQTIVSDPAIIIRAIVAIAIIAIILASRVVVYGWQIAVGLALIAGCAISPISLNFLLIYLAASGARALSQLLNNTWQTRLVRSVAATAMLLAVATVGLGAVAFSGLKKDAFGTGLRPNIFPETAAGRLASLPLRNAILNDQTQGGYLAWRTWPLWKICADMRPTLYDAAFWDNYGKLWQGGRGWEEMLNYWRVWAVLGSPDILRKYPNDNLYYRLADSPDWNAVWWDSESILYMKTDADLSDSNLQPYRQLKPGLTWSALAARMKTPKQWRELAADLRRVTMEDRTNILAQEFLKLAEAEVNKL